MSTLLNRLIVATMPALPRFIVGRFARRYVAGETAGQALDLAQSLNENGFEVTLDILGEHVRSAAEAGDVAAAYADLYHQIAATGVRANISLKPTHLGLDLGRELCRTNLLKVLAAGRDTGNFLRIDMEDSPHTDETIGLYLDCREQYDQVGSVLQAYLHRSADDLARLMSPGFNFRLCKGIYREPPEVAIQDRAAISDNFVTLARQAFTGGAYLAIATHDLPLIDRLEALIRELGVPPERFEFQV
ncbi:MAG: proline dehydrogenase family protein, partial [Candidatus Neomarinimicrobiota bacterium]